MTLDDSGADLLGVGERMFRTCTHDDVAASLETIGAGFAIFEAQRGGALLVSANSLFETITIKSVEESIGRPLNEIVPKVVEKQIRSQLTLCAVKQRAQETEMVVERDGKPRWWRVVISPVLSEDGDHKRMIMTLIEITEKKHLQRKLEATRQRYAALVDSATDGIITIDHNQVIKMINESAKRMFGIDKDETVVGEHLSRFIPEHAREYHTRLIDAFRVSDVESRPMDARAPLFGLRADGTEIEIEVSISKIRVGEKIEMMAVIRDISEHTKLIEQLKQAATHDSLTGIYNRRHGASLLNTEMHRSQRFGQALTVAMLDIDHFKNINDTYGHACGDLVLNSFVATISKTLRISDTVCRWGGEEFLVILPGASTDDALNWAERAREAVASLSTVGVGENAIKITASFGVASLAKKDVTVEEILKRADDALYRAKGSGRNRVVVDEKSVMLRSV
jgi:diguanylate cyclase (GGDEF)-like protein/PAS domain S-box-containing protein